MGETLQVVGPRVLCDKRHLILSTPLPDGRRHHDSAIWGQDRDVMMVPVHHEGGERHDVSLRHGDEPWDKEVTGDFSVLGGGLLGLSWALKAIALGQLRGVDGRGQSLSVVVPPLISTALM
jgi:hypothetical protein